MGVLNGHKVLNYDKDWYKTYNTNKEEVMKTIALSIVLVLVLLSVTMAQPNPDTLWTRIYQEGHRTWANDIQLTNDGGYIIAGFAQMDPNLLYQGCLIKIDSLGNEEWTRTYGGSEDDEFNSVQPTSDGGFIAAGWTESYGFPDGYSNFYLVKTDALGDTIWTSALGGNSVDRAYCIRSTNDGYVFVGYSASEGISVPNSILYKVDVNGDSVWVRTFGGSYYEQIYHVEATSDGGYILCGNISDTLNQGSTWLIKTDSQGDTLWTKRPCGSINGSFESVQQTSDGGYVCCGNTDEYGPQWNDDGWVVKMNDQGDTTWVSVFDLTQWDFIYSIQQTFNGDYIIGGWVDFNPNVRGQMLLYKVSGEGSLLWYRTYEGSGIVSYGTSARQTSDGGYIVAGYTGGNLEEGVPFGYVVKTGYDEASAVQPETRGEILTTLTLFPAYPNPFNSTTKISYDLAKSGNVQLNIYNILGQLAGTLVDRWQAPGSYSISWEAGSLPSGIYFCQVKVGDFSQVRKMLLLK
jgi:hypothetical protein